MRRYVHGHAPTLLGLAAAAALMSAPPATAGPGGPSCDPAGRAFPLTTRIHGGPAVYEAGGGFATWYLDLVNTTPHTCAGVHPVVVLVDERHALKPAQPRLEFYDGTRTHPVRFESTDEDELVGAFGGAGLTVGPGKTVTVKVRLAVAEDAVPNEVTANAAVVQRHDGDGDWIGQSNDYRFAIKADTGAEAEAGTNAGTGTGPALTPAPTPAPPAVSASPGTGRDPLPLPFADELARTGLGSPPAAVATTIALLLAGGALLLGRRRR